MKKLKLMMMSALFLGMLVSCGGSKGGDTPTPTPDPDPTPTPDPVDKVELVDSRVDAFVAVSGTVLSDGTIEEDGDTETFKSLYEAANYVFDEYDNGSYVYKLGDEAKTKLSQKRGSEDSISGATTDQWYYYVDGSTLDGYSSYIQGDTNFFINEKKTRLMSSTDSLKFTYQPYSLLGRDSTVTTQGWNLLPMQDTSIRYNPHSFTGIQTVTYKFDLSEAKIRPSYNESQTVIPMITISSVDSYNWSNQGIYMDTATGNWYYIYGETQSDTKLLNYDTDEVILTSKFSKADQEFTPENDVRMTLTYRFVESDEVWVNDLTIEILSGETVTKTITKTYEYNSMTACGTPRANISMDLVSSDDSLDESTFAPDYMCGAYFKNIKISEGYGSVKEGLTDDEYGGDADMCCTPGETYDLLACKDSGDADLEVILDHYDAITYHDDIKDYDLFDISYEQEVADATRTSDILDVEALIAKIGDEDTKESASVIKANAKYSALHTTQARLVAKFDGYKQLANALER